MCFVIAKGSKSATHVDFEVCDVTERKRIQMKFVRRICFRFQIIRRKMLSLMILPLRRVRSAIKSKRTLRCNIALLREDISLLQDGIWYCHARYCFHESDLRCALIETFKRIVPGKCLGRILLRKSGGDSNILSAGVRSQCFCASTVYIARDQRIKYFDRRGSVVWTRISEAEWERKKQMLSVPLFRYFSPPASRFIDNESGSFEEQELILSPHLAIRSFEEKKNDYVRILETYREYVVDQDDILGDTQIAVLEFDRFFEGSAMRDLIDINTLRKYYLDLIARTKVVPAHGDFNIANVLISNGIYLIDNDDAGMKLPAFYDVVNLAYNEVNYWKDTSWVDVLFSKSVFKKFNLFLSSCITNFSPKDIAIVFVCYLVSLHSLAVRKNLKLRIIQDKSEYVVVYCDLIKLLDRYKDVSIPSFLKA